MDALQLAHSIELTKLAPATTRLDVTDLITKARQRNCFGICVNPVHIRFAADLIARNGGDLKIISVVGFPLGANITMTKAIEASQAIADGADEIDMVLNIGALKWGDDRAVQEDIHYVVGACHGIPLKVIIESAALTDEEIVRACHVAEDAGAQFVKTSTGTHSNGGATVRAVQLIRKTVGDRLRIKASGGIRTGAAARELIEAGATRIGASDAKAILGT